MEQERWSFLLEGYLTGALSESERGELTGVLMTDAGRDFFFQRVGNDLEEHRFEVDEDLNQVYERLLSSLFARIKEESKRQEEVVAPVVPLRNSRKWYWAAAGIAGLLICVSFFVYTFRSGAAGTGDGLPSAGMIRQGGNRALLKLGDGTVIELDSAGKGLLAHQQGVAIEKTDSGRVSYSQKTPGSIADSIVYNTIETPRGGEYQVVLQDGSRVWLNSASSIRFPTVFSGDSRTVEVTGEVYFEVTKDKSKPFRVRVGGIVNEVLGTEFNVNAYDDEPYTKITLVEGRIKVSNPQFSTIILPGQQVTINNESHSVKTVNITPEIAWKNGYFEFRNVPIETVMRQLARWYDLQIIYDGKPTKQFLATIPRDASIVQVLRVLEYTDAVHFSVNGKVVTVKP